MAKSFLTLFFLMLSSQIFGLDFDRDLKSLSDISKGPQVCSTAEDTAPEGEWCQDLHGWACKQPVEPDGTESDLPPTQERTAKAIADVESSYVKDLTKLMASDKETLKAVDGIAALYCENCVDAEAKAKAFIANFWNDSKKLKYVPNPFEPRVFDVPDYPVYTDELQKLSQKYLSQVGEKARDKVTEKKIETEIFPNIKELLIEEIKKSVADPASAQKMIAKIEKVRFAGTQCQDNALASNQDRRAFYVESEQDPHFFYCGGFLAETTSEFRIAYIMAHELSHSVDPCKLPDDQKDFIGREKLDAKFPASEILSCLRSPDSIEAKWDNDLVTGKDTTFPKSALTCFGDQINESYADWMAAQVLPKFLAKRQSQLTSKQTKNGYASIARSLSCEAPQVGFNPGKKEEVEPHPPARRRINRVLMANPELRKQVDCDPNPKTPVYCEPGMDPKKYRPAVTPVEPSGFNFGGGGLGSPLAFPHQQQKHEGCFH